MLKDEVYAENNKEKCRESCRKWRENNPDKQKIASRNWSRNNPDKIKEYSKRQKQKKRDYVNKFKVNGCSICNFNDIDCLVFHHKDPSTKLYDIAELVDHCSSYEKIDIELKKCIVICRNCHAKIYAGGISD